MLIRLITLALLALPLFAEDILVDPEVKVQVREIQLEISNAEIVTRDLAIRDLQNRAKIQELNTLLSKVLTGVITDKLGEDAKVSDYQFTPELNITKKEAKEGE